MQEVIYGGKQTLVEGESCGGEELTRLSASALCFLLLSFPVSPNTDEWRDQSKCICGYRKEAKHNASPGTISGQKDSEEGI